MRVGVVCSLGKLRHRGTPGGTAGTQERWEPVGRGKKGWGEERADRGCGEGWKQGEVKGGGLGGECRVKGGGVQGRMGVQGCSVRGFGVRGRGQAEDWWGAG